MLFPFDVRGGVNQNGPGEIIPIFSLTAVRSCRITTFKTLSKSENFTIISKQKSNCSPPSRVKAQNRKSSCFYTNTFRFFLDNIAFLFYDPDLINTLLQVKSHEKLFWIKGNFGIMSAHYRHDAATRYIYRDSPGWWCNHAEEASCTA